MKIKVEGLDELEGYIRKRADQIVQAYLDDLNFIGLKAVSFIRDRSTAESWEDQTGNLRSSIGYVIVRDGQILNKGGFGKVTGKTASDVDGSSEGSSYAERLARNYPTGYALIIVAGMNYAAYVEAKENKDVLASGELFLKKEMAQLVERYNSKYGAK